MARIFNPNQKITGSVGAVLIIAILLVLNTILQVSSVPYVDVSPNKIHTLSPITLETIQQIDPLEPPVTIDFYYTPDVIGLPREVKEAGKEIQRLLALYKETAGSRLEIRHFYPNPLSEDEDDLAVVREAQNKGVRRFERYWTQNTSIIYCGLVFSRGKKNYLFDNIDAELLPQLEFKITSAIYACIQTDLKKLGIISGLDFQAKQAGKDEDGNPQLLPEWQILTRLKKEFDVHFLTQPAKEIPSCDVLLVVQPRGLSEEDYQSIDHHVLQGKGALFCEAPFSFQELILLSRDQQIMNLKVQELLQEEAQKTASTAEQEFEEEMQRIPEAYAAWKHLKNIQESVAKSTNDTELEQGERLVQEALRAFQMQIFTKEEVMKSFQKFQEKMKQANTIARGMAQPEYGGEAAKAIEAMENKAKENLPVGRLINTKLLQPWGIQLLKNKLLFIPVPEGEDATLAQFSFTVGGPNGNPKSFAQNRLETQNMEALHLSFSGVLDRFGDYSNPVYHSLVRVDKQFSFFVPGEKSKIQDWFALESFEKFLSFNPTGQRRGSRFEEWQKAIQTKGDQLSGWFDVAVALEGEFPAAMPSFHLFTLDPQLEKEVDWDSIWSHLKQGKFPESLRPLLEKKQVLLSQELQLIPHEKKGDHWTLLDPSHQKEYLLVKHTETVKKDQETKEENKLAFNLKSPLSKTKAGAKSRIVVIASTDMLELNTVTEEQREKQRENHHFILETLKNLALSPEIASLSNVGNETNRFDLLDELVREAENEAKISRKALEEDREKKRAQAKAQYEEVLRKFPSKRQTLNFGGAFAIDVGEYVPDEQRVAMEQAEQQLEKSLEDLKKEERKKIETIEYYVANATRQQKNTVRLYGTFTPPFFILILGLLSFYWIQHARKN